MLTRKQHQLLILINERLNATGVAPSFDEMKEALGLKSKSGIHRLISGLEERGFIRRLAHRARALEVLRGTGKPISAWRAEQGDAELPYRILQVAIAPKERSVLHQRIEQRLEQMFSGGFVNEVRMLHRRGDLHGNLPAIRAVGYRQVWDYLDGETGEAEMRQRALFATRQLAKRQYTWLRKWPDLHWVLWNDAKISLLPDFLAMLTDVDFQVDGLY